MSLTGIVHRHRPGALLGLAILLAAGAYELAILPAGAYPEATFPRIAVVVHGGTFEPREMVVAVTRPMEEALAGVIGLRRIRSRTVRGGAEINLDFRPNSDVQFALQQVQGKIAAIRGSLPDGLEILAERLTLSVFPMMQYELTGAAPTLLRDLAQFTVRPALAGIQDVGEVEVQGGLVREIAVVLDPTRLAAQGVSVTMVGEAIKKSNQIAAAGRVDKEYRQFSILVSGLAASPDAVGEIIVKHDGTRLVRVSDLGTVGYGSEDVFQLAAGNGQPAALINITRQPGGNTLRVQRDVEAAIRRIEPTLPTGVALEQVYNQAGLVRSSIASVRDAMIIGGVLAIVMLMVFLKRIDLALIAGVSIPLTILGTFAGLGLFHDSLNLMSLGGLAVAIGLVIDDAVVVVDNLERHLRIEAGGSEDIIRRATDQILAPVAGSTLTTVVVFLPLGLLEGVVGQFFRSFSLSLSIAVLLSLIIAVTIIPILATFRFRRKGPSGMENHRRHAVPSRLHRRYIATLNWLLDHRPLAASAAIAVALGLWVMSTRTETGFLPEMDEGGFILDYWTPTGTSLSESNRMVGEIEKILHSDSSVQAFTRRTGAELGFFATEPNRGDMTVLLKTTRDESVFEAIARIRERIETSVPAVRVEFVLILQDLIGDLTGNPEPVEIKVFHPDGETARRVAENVAKAVESVPGLVDLFDGNQGALPSLLVKLDPARTAAVGLTMEDAATEARAALFGMEAGEVREPDRVIPIRVRLPDSVRFRTDIAEELPIVGPAGWVPLKSIATVEQHEEPSELVRENLRPVVIVTGAVDRTTSSLGGVMKDVRKRLAKVPSSPGVTLELGGQYANQQESFHQLLLVFGLSASAVLLVMLIQFRSMRGPLMILVAALLGTAGAVAALMIVGIPFNVSSFMGLILLIGLIVKNGIILLDAAIKAHEGGRSPREALLEAASLRIRPIMMTTLCTLAGLVPLALGLGSGAELQRPLAVAVIGGLGLSTAMTLLLLPVGLDWSGALAAATEA